MRTVLITGGSRGIGAATARLFAAQGDRVFINYQKDEANAKTLCEEIGATALKGDVASPADVDRMFQSMPGIDVLVNNAGFAQFQFFDALTDEDWQRMLAVTLSGAFYCIRRALPHMIHQKSGAIVNVSSIWGLTGAACEVAYSAAKVFGGNPYAPELAYYPEHNTLSPLLRRLPRRSAPPASASTVWRRASSIP